MVSQFPSPLPKCKLLGYACGLLPNGNWGAGLQRKDDQHGQLLFKNGYIQWLMDGYYFYWFMLMS